MTEQNKRENFDAQSALMRAEKIGREIENMNLPKKLKAELKEIASRVTVNLATASARQVEAVAKKMDAETNRMVGIENAKYTRERSRGYNESWTDSDNVNSDIRGLSFGLTKDVYKRQPTGFLLNKSTLVHSGKNLP